MSESVTLNIVPAHIGPYSAGRLDAAVRAVCPIDGVSISAASVRIDFKDAATAQQRVDAIAVANTFVWSVADEDSHQRVSTRASVLRRLAKSDDDVAMAMRGMLKIINMGMNQLRTSAGLPNRTIAQVMADFTTIINSGAAD